MASRLFMWLRRVSGEGTQAILLGFDTRGGERGRMPLGVEWRSCLDHLVPCLYRWYAEYHDDVVFYCVQNVKL